VIQPKPHELRSRERLDVLQYHMFLKEKHAGQIKGIGCAEAAAIHAEGGD